MRKPTYYELLRHPNWQKKRLEIMEAAGFKCEYCDSGENTLNVHHAYYEKGLMPWDYPNESLHCLCEDCHKSVQDRQTLLQRQIGKIGLEDIAPLIGYAMGLESRNHDDVPLDIFSYECAMGIGDYWGLDADEVIDAVVERQVDGYKLHQLSLKKRGSPLSLAPRENE